MKTLLSKSRVFILAFFLMFSMVASAASGKWGFTRDGKTVRIIENKDVIVSCFWDQDGNWLGTVYTQGDHIMYVWPDGEMHIYL